MYAKFQLHPPYGFREDFESFFVIENLPFMSPRQPIKLSDLDKSRMKVEDYSINISVKKIKYPQ